MQLLSDFILEKNGHQYDFDGNEPSSPYFAQCVDLAKAWARNIGTEVHNGNAITWAGLGGSYTWIRNSAFARPQPGDLVVWNISRPYGHIGICISSNLLNMRIFSQNYSRHQFCTIDTISYSNCLGWLRPHAVIAQPAPLPPAQEWPRLVTALRTCYVRSAPRISAPLAGSQRLNPNDQFQALRLVQGDNIAGNSLWAESSSHHFVWAGNLKY